MTALAGIITAAGVFTIKRLKAPARILALPTTVETVMFALPAG
jgi:hypothetical protein